MEERTDLFPAFPPHETRLRYPGQMAQGRHPSAVIQSERWDTGGQLQLAKSIFRDYTLRFCFYQP